MPGIVGTVVIKQEALDGLASYARNVSTRLARDPTVPSGVKGDNTKGMQRRGARQTGVVMVQQYGNVAQGRRSPDEEKG